MVIQSTMTPKAIFEIWETTKGIFEKYNVPLSDKSLKSILHDDLLVSLLTELNEEIGSSSVTCIEGG